MASNADVVNLDWEMGDRFHDPDTHGRTPFSPELMGGIIEDANRWFPYFRVRVNETQILAETVITRSTFSGTHGGKL